MILHELVGLNENDPIYRRLEATNADRYYRFLESIVEAALASESIFLSQTVIKAFNHHAIVCLHDYAGEYRPCPVRVNNYVPPDFHRVHALMDDFVNRVNRNWDKWDPTYLASYVLWRLNYIHPFVNGNGRTARAACYFVLCLKLGSWLSGQPILPVLLKTQYRAEYVEHLSHADRSYQAGDLDLAPLEELVSVALLEQWQIDVGAS